MLYWRGIVARWLEELKQEIQEEEWRKFWLTYGTYIVIVCVVILGGIGGYLMWSSYQTSRAERYSARYEEALQLVHLGKKDEAEALLNSIYAAYGDKGYGVMARIELVSLAYKRARGTYDPDAVQFWRQSIEALARESARRRQLGMQSYLTLSLAYGSIPFSGQRLPELAMYASPRNPWKGLSLEVSALKDAQEKSYEKAGLTYTNLLGSAQSGLRGRTEMALIALQHSYAG